MTVFFVLFMPLLICLGIWQVGRAAEKNALESDYLAALTTLPVAADTITAVDQLAAFTRVRLRGVFAHQLFLLDNQLKDGAPGYWVIQRFVTDAGRSYLLNRGYIAAPPQRSDMPEVPTPDDNLTVVGTIWPYTGLLPVLDGDPWSVAWPKRIQQLNIARMAQLTGAESVEIRLEPGQPGVLTAAPFAAVLSDDKHLGYAATWFGLALVLLAGYVTFGVRAVQAPS